MATYNMTWDICLLSYSYTILSIQCRISLLTTQLSNIAWPCTPSCVNKWLVSWISSSYLDNDELFLLGLSIWPVLTEAEVDLKGWWSGRLPFLIQNEIWGGKNNKINSHKSTQRSQVVTCSFGASCEVHIYEFGSVLHIFWIKWSWAILCFLFFTSPKTGSFCSTSVIKWAKGVELIDFINRMPPQRMLRLSSFIAILHQQYIKCQYSKLLIYSDQYHFHYNSSKLWSSNKIQRFPIVTLGCNSYVLDCSLLL